MTDKTLFGCTFEQHKANRELWYQALLSGNYPQGKGALQSQSGYCCLGVGCLVYEQNAVNPTKLPRYTEVPKEGLLIGGVLDNETSLIEVRKWLGLRTPTGDVLSLCSLASRNDNGASFKEIVDLCKRYEDELFFTEDYYIEESSNAN